MKFNTTHTLQEIAQIIGCSYVGADVFPVFGMNEIHVVTPGDIVFVDHPKYYDKALQSAATIVLINKEVECPAGKALLISDDPFRDFNTLTRHFMPFVSAQAAISPSAQIGEGTVIQPNCFVGNHVKIGRNCLIHANVTVYDHTLIGDNVIIHSGTVLGADAFYYKKRPNGSYDRLLSCGRVIVHDAVEIGAACTIDKGVSGDTILGEGTKLDNQVHLGHGVVVGKNCLIAAQVGVGGKTRIADGVCLWGQVGVQKDIDIGEGANVLGQSGVTKSIPGGKTYFGTPARDVRDVHRETIGLRRLLEP
jgi:UDP-3-O-[3-hydroxymyristoyl] glucosamine N-acyltransferase